MHFLPEIPPKFEVDYEGMRLPIDLCVRNSVTALEWCMEHDKFFEEVVARYGFKRVWLNRAKVASDEVRELWESYRSSKIGMIEDLLMRYAITGVGMDGNQSQINVAMALMTKLKQESSNVAVRDMTMDKVDALRAQRERLFARLALEPNDDD
jgi:hypothetical protein